MLPPPTSSSDYQLMLSENRAVLLLIDPEDGKIIDASQGACLFYGYSMSELAKMKISDINILSEAEIKAEMERVRLVSCHV